MGKNEERERERELSRRLCAASLCSFILEVICLPQLLFPPFLLPLTAHHSMRPPVVPTSCARNVMDMSSTIHCADSANPATSKIYLFTYLPTTLSLFSFALPVVFSLTCALAHSRTLLVVFRSVSFTVSPLSLPLFPFLSLFLPLLLISPRLLVSLSLALSFSLSLSD